MPFNFSGSKGNTYNAKLRVVDDGETFTVSSVDGYTITSTLSQNSVFTANPVVTGTGSYSITTKDPVVMLMDFEVSTLLTSGHYLSAQKNLPTKDALGRMVLNFTFNVAGTPTNFLTGGVAQQFIIHIEYTESTY